MCILLIVIIILATTPSRLFHLYYWDNFVTLTQNPLVITVVAFFLTSFIGTKISQSLQDRAWRNQEDERKKSKQLEVAADLFEEMSSLMDKRLYLERRVLYSHSDKEKGKPDMTMKCFSDYNTFLYEWNCSLNKNICKLDQYFGREVKAFFHDRIMKDFNWIGMLLRRIHFNENVPSYNVVLNAIDTTNERVFKLDQMMLEILKNENVGSFLKEKNR